MSLTIKAFETEPMVRTSEKDTMRNIFGGNLKLADDPIAQRRKEAQEAAWNVVKNAWDNDDAVDTMMDARRGHYAQMEVLKEEAVAALDAIQGEKEALLELYQDESSEEYKSRLKELNEQADEWERRIADADKQMRDDTADLYSIKKERLKANPMEEAKEAADEILKAANDEIIGMLMQESKEHVDEEMEEAKEAAEESIEEKEEREEQLDELKLKRAVWEALVEGTEEAVEKAKAIERETKSPEITISEMVDMAQGNDVTKEVGQSLNDIKSSMNLLEADLKGIKVDEEV